MIPQLCVVAALGVTIIAPKKSTEIKRTMALYRVVPNIIVIAPDYELKVKYKKPDTS